MFEARLTQGKVFKQLIEALKDLVQEANIDCSDDEMSIQAMDNSHVALVAVSLRSGGFDHFRCDRPISLGFNATNMGKILKCAGNDDIITLKAEDDGDSLALVFESPGQDRIADFGELFIIYQCVGMVGGTSGDRAICLDCVVPLLSDISSQVDRVHCTASAMFIFIHRH
jgi:proliferating cell nuclear antigen PCNA